MKKIVGIISIVSLVMAVSLSSCKQSGAKKSTEAAVDTTLNYLTAQEKADGWILMFDGKTTNGWRGYGKPTFPDSGWVVEDGTLRCIGSGQGEAGGKGGDIIYDNGSLVGYNFHLVPFSGRFGRNFCRNQVIERSGFSVAVFPQHGIGMFFII